MKFILLLLDLVSRLSSYIVEQHLWNPVKPVSQKNSDLWVDRTFQSAITPTKEECYSSRHQTSFENWCVKFTSFFIVPLSASVELPGTVKRIKKSCWFNPTSNLQTRGVMTPLQKPTYFLPARVIWNSDLEGALRTVWNSVQMKTSNTPSVEEKRIKLAGHASWQRPQLLANN